MINIIIIFKLKNPPTFSTSTSDLVKGQIEKLNA